MASHRDRSGHPDPAPPIAFHDDYDHPDDRIEYILENELMPAPHQNDDNNTAAVNDDDDDDVAVHAYRNLSELFDSRFTVGCPANCSCCCRSPPSATITTCPCTRSRSPAASNYIRPAAATTAAASSASSGAAARALVLNPARASLDLVYECGPQCACQPSRCGNRLVQFGPRRDLRIVQTATTTMPKGWSVIWDGGAGGQSLPTGAFVCEYAGEVLTAAEASRRHASEAYGRLGANYVLCMREQQQQQQQHVDDGQVMGIPMAVTQTFIDPTRRGNVGRYLNHSCEPNCEIVSVRVDGPIPRVGE